MNHSVADLSLAWDVSNLSSGQNLWQRHKNATKQTTTKKPKPQKIFFNSIQIVFFTVYSTLLNQW